MRESDILASTYHDRMDIIRHVEVEDSDSHLTTMQKKTIKSNVACELDKASTGYHDETLVIDYIVYTRPEEDIVEGDMLSVTHLGRSYECAAGIPFKWPSHLEIPVSLKERL